MLLIPQKGRPLGAKNGMRMIMPWRPLSWKPIYETMVALHCVGYTYKEIAAQHGFSVIQVGNIIRSPKAQKIIAQFKDNIRKTTTENETEALSRIKASAIKRVEDLIHNDDLATDHPFRMADFSVTLLKGLGSLSSDTHNPGPAVAAQNIFIGNDIAAKLFDGMQKANEAALLNSGKTEIVVSPEPVAVK